MAGAGRAGMNESAGRSERVEYRLHVIEVGLVASHHQAVAVVETPDSTAYTGVDESDLFVRKLLASSYRVVVIGIAAVDDEIAGREEGRKLGDRVFGRASGRNHQPDNPPW